MRATGSHQRIFAILSSLVDPVLQKEAVRLPLRSVSASL